EGIKIHFLAAPNRIKGVDGKVSGLECVKMELGPPDDTGRRRPVRIEGSEFTIDVDNVIAAIGQVPDTTYLKDQVETTAFGTLKVDSETLETTSVGIFAGGDCVTGPSSVVEAIAAGKRAAIAIDDYLKEI
ncbi:FAD-dependent oxidoreductase, partial [archaeon]|nr:FAD-dependent oxidoreductase [archaeon]